MRSERNLLFTLIIQKDDVPERGLPLSLLCGTLRSRGIEDIYRSIVQVQSSRLNGRTMYFSTGKRSQAFSPRERGNTTW
jgi:Mor family transcriptional regulator